MQLAGSTKPTFHQPAPATSPLAHPLAHPPAHQAQPSQAVYNPPNPNPHPSTSTRRHQTLPCATPHLQHAAHRPWRAVAIPGGRAAAPWTTRGDGDSDLELAAVTQQPAPGPSRPAKARPRPFPTCDGAAPTLSYRQRRGTALPDPWRRGPAPPRAAAAQPRTSPTGGGSAPPLLDQPLRGPSPPLIYGGARTR